MITLLAAAPTDNNIVYSKLALVIIAQTLKMQMDFNRLSSYPNNIVIVVVIFS